MTFTVRETKKVRLSSNKPSATRVTDKEAKQGCCRTRIQYMVHVKVKVKIKAKFIYIAHFQANIAAQSV